MTTANDIVAKAKSQIGIKEKPAGSNNVKYNTAYYGQEVYDGLWGTKFPWCCVFVWWVFRECCAHDMFYGGKKTASCTTLMEYYKGKGQFSKTPKIGSLVFFNWGKGTTAKHIGIVAKVNADGSFSTIEGNTAVGNDSNGGEVMERKRYMKDVLGFAYPYTKQGSVKTVAVTLNVLKKGAKGNDVKALQTLLIGYGFDCGASGADGSFGGATDKAVRAYQKAKGLAVDGSVGANTWNKLLKG